MEYHILHLKKFYEQILNHIPADIAVFNKKHQYVFVNQTAVQDNNLREWLMNKDDYEFAKARGKDIAFADIRREAFTQAVSTKQVYEFWKKVSIEKGNISLIYVVFSLSSKIMVNSNLW
jgi:hypothetical protein